MAFDWQEYLTFADEIKSRTDEAAKRTAISRAYYCVFHKAKSYAEDHLGYVYRIDNPSHSGMWIKFTQKGITLKKIHDYGVKLKDFRRDADYDDKKDIENSLIQTFHYANHILTLLENLTKKTS